MARPLLSLVPQPDPRPADPAVVFCGHCGERPETASNGSRVCEGCGLGLLLQAPAEAAPSHGDAFIVLDRSLSVCGVSAAAEALLGIREIDAVNRHVTQLLVPPDAEAPGLGNVAAAVIAAARGDAQPHTAVVRPAATFGIRLKARIAPCGPPQAAILVFE